MANKIDSTGGTFDKVSVGGGIAKNGDVSTATTNLNNCRALIKITAVRNFTITGHINYSSGYTSTFDNDLILFILRSFQNTLGIYIPYWSYSGSAHTITYAAIKENNMISPSQIIPCNDKISSSGIHTVTFTASNDLLIEYTPGITTITIN